MPGQENGAKKICSLSNRQATIDNQPLHLNSTPLTCPWFHLIFQRPFPTDISFLHHRRPEICFTW